MRSAEEIIETMTELSGRFPTQRKAELVEIIRAVQLEAIEEAIEAAARVAERFAESHPEGHPYWSGRRDAAKGVRMFTMLDIVVRI